MKKTMKSKRDSLRRAFRKTLTEKLAFRFMPFSRTAKEWREIYSSKNVRVEDTNYHACACCSEVFADNEIPYIVQRQKSFGKTYVTVCTECAKAVADEVVDYGEARANA